MEILRERIARDEYEVDADKVAAAILARLLSAPVTPERRPQCS